MVVTTMTETTNVEQSSDGLLVDKSRQYKANAGQCQQCGFFKTWEFKVVNLKSGKGMPGHVTKDGFKIGDGNCPYWGNLAKMNAAKAEKKKAAAEKPQPPGTWIQEITGSRDVASTALPASPPPLAPPVSSPGTAVQQIPVVKITIGSMRVELSTAEALRIAKDILDQLAA